jgi:hypothetical protein
VMAAPVAVLARPLLAMAISADIRCHGRQPPRSLVRPLADCACCWWTTKKPCAARSRST